MVLQNATNNKLSAGLKVALGGDATGDLYYRDGSGYFVRLPIGTNGQNFTVIAGLPGWTTGSSPGGSAGGDLTGSYPNPSIALNTVTFGKIQNISTANFLGRASAGTGSVESLTASQVQTALGLGTAAYLNSGTASGNVPTLDVNGQLNTSVLPSIALTSIQVVANSAARLALSNVQPGDSAKQSDNGITYLLSATPASTDANWIPIGDTTIVASDIVSGIIATAQLGSGTATSSTYLRGDQSWAAIPTQSLPGNSVTGTTANLAPDNSYRVNNASLVTLTLPATAAVDTTIRVIGIGAGGWRVAQNAGQTVYFGDKATTVGVTGQLNSSYQRDCLTMICVTANTEWQVIGSQGNIDVV